MSRILPPICSISSSVSKSSRHWISIPIPLEKSPRVFISSFAHSSGFTRLCGFAGTLHQWSQPGPPEPLRRISPLSIIATFAPFRAAVIAAQHPAMPPPKTTTSTSYSVSSPNLTGYGHSGGVPSFCRNSFHVPINYPPSILVKNN